jgi:putative hydrolase of the HAD superfamily
MPFKAIFFDIGNTLISRKAWLPGALEAVQAIRDQRIKTGIISNTGDLDRDQLAKLLPDDFDFGLFEEHLTILSSEVGVQKPNLGIFSLAVQHAGCSPWESMFVGESLTETLAAQQAGMASARIVNPKPDFKALVNWLD